MSDPEFVKKHVRDSAQSQVGHPIDWVYFENNPEQAKDNALFRKEHARTEYDKSRDEQEEFRKIDDLSEQYDLPKGVSAHPIVDARSRYKQQVEE